MNQRERDSLDRHITGNYGEDQYPIGRDHLFEAWPDEPNADECYECERPESEHAGPSRTTAMLRRSAILSRARAYVAAELGVDEDEVS